MGFIQLFAIIFLLIPKQILRCTTLISQTFLFFFGPPGAGKGEQARRLSENLQIPHISSGALLREESKKKTPFSAHINKLLKAGQFLADEQIIEIISNRIQDSDCQQGFILDGFPRTLNQARVLDDKLSKDFSLSFINISIKEETLIKRLMGRRICSSCTQTYHIDFLPPKQMGICNLCSSSLTIRNDDTKEVITKRLEIFNQEFLPMVEYYQDHKSWFEVPSEGTPLGCFEKLLDHLAPALNQHANI